MERGNGLKDVQSMNLTFLLSILQNIYTPERQKAYLPQYCEGARNHSLHEAD